MITLTRTSPHDAEELWDILKDSPDLFSLTFDPKITSLVDCRMACSHLSELEWAWTIRYDDSVVGSCTLLRGHGPQAHVAELGGWIDPIIQKMKLGSEAVVKMLTFGRENGLKRIESRPWETNVGACRVLEKAGMKLESVRKNSIMRSGNLLAERVYVWLDADQGVEVPCPGQLQLEL